MASGRLRWCLKDCLWFLSRLTLPPVEIGDPERPFVVEPFQRFILGMVFRTGRVELLVLLPKGNGKTTLFAGLAIFHLLTTSNAECFIGAADKEQADTMYRYARAFVESEPELAALIDIRPSTREMRSRADLGFIRVLASDSSKGGGKRHSYNPTLALIDELHAHDNDNLYVALRSAAFKRGGIVVTITTAGNDLYGSALGLLRTGMLDFAHRGGAVARGLTIAPSAEPVADELGRLLIAESRTGNTTMVEWACTGEDLEALADAEGRDDFDADTALAPVLLSNPATFVTLASLVDALEAPGMTYTNFARYRANFWAQAEDAVIKERIFDACFEEGATIPAGSTTYLVVDAAQVNDTAAVAELWLRRAATKDLRAQVVVMGHVWAMPSGKAGVPDPAHHTLVTDRRYIGQQVIRDYIRGYQKQSGKTLIGVVYDPKFFTESAEILSNEGFKMIEFDQQPARTVPASRRLLEAFHAKEIVHDGDPVLRSHATSAGRKDVGEEWRFSKAMSAKPIDLLIGVMMGLGSVLAGGSVYETRGLLGA